MPFQLSQRADFFEEEVGLETTLKRPIVNTRDEPHCDPQKYRRLHVIVGDANLSEVATFLKVGTTAIVLAMIEDDVMPLDLALARPVQAIRQVSHDPSLGQTVALRDGRRLTALDVQWQLLEHAKKYERERGLACVGEDVGPRHHPALGGSALRARARPRHRRHHRRLGGQGAVHDGVSRAPQPALERPAAAGDGSPVPRRAPEKSLFNRLNMERITTDAQVARATTEPPLTTRAYFRGKCLQKWASDIVAANWDSMVFDIGSDPLRRVPMMEPLRGTVQHVGALLEECDTAAELLDRLGAS